MACGLRTVSDAAGQVERVMVLAWCMGIGGWMDEMEMDETKIYEVKNLGGN